MKNIFFYINFFILLLFIAFFALTFINPAHFPVSNLSSVFSPYLALFLIFYFALFLIIQFSKKWLYIAGIFISFIVLSKNYYIDFNSDPNETIGLKVLSYNVSFFSVEKVFKEEYYDTKKNKEVQLIRNFIINERPDIISLQEFFNDKNSQIYNTIERFEKLGYQYYLKSKPRHDNGLNRGLITFSKHPIIQSGIIADANNEYNGAIYTDLNISEKDTLRFINVHLSSMELYKGNKSWLKFIKPFYRAYSSATVERIHQLENIKPYIFECPYNVIIAGDFNETQYSYLYRSFNLSLESGFEEKGSGLGYTFPFKIPGVGVRIDHMFYSPSVEIINYNTYSKLNFSEHKPIIGSFKVK